MEVSLCAYGSSIMSTVAGVQYPGYTRMTWWCRPFILSLNLVLVQSVKFVQRQLALINAHDQNYFHLIQQGVIEESITSWLQYEHRFWRLVIQALFKELTPWPHLGWLKIKWLTLPHLFPLAKKVSSERESWRVLKKMRHKCLSLLWWLWSRSNSLLCEQSIFLDSTIEETLYRICR